MHIFPNALLCVYEILIINHIHTTSRQPSSMAAGLTAFASQYDFLRLLNFHHYSIQTSLWPRNLSGVLIHCQTRWVLPTLAPLSSQVAESLAAPFDTSQYDFLPISDTNEEIVGWQHSVLNHTGTRGKWLTQQTRHRKKVVLHVSHANYITHFWDFLNLPATVIVCVSFLLWSLTSTLR